MTDATSTSEQVKRIIQRWKSVKRPLYIMSKFALGIFLLSVLYSHFFSRRISGCTRAVWLLMFFGSLSICIYYKKINTLVLNHFARSLNDEERDSLAFALIEADYEERETIQEILKACHKIHPQMEYLRPSQQPQGDGTLLRAATHHDDTPQEQLLRPTENP
jgi:uncharacterized membrane protein